MRSFKTPAGLCAVVGLLLGLAFGRYRAASLLGAGFADAWPLVIPVLILAVIVLAGGPEPDRCDRPSGFRIVQMLAACALFLAGLTAWMFPTDLGPFRMVQIIFPLLTGFGILLSASDDPGELPALASVIPVFYQGYLLLQLYRANATDTHRAVFAVELFCVIAILLSVYGAAAQRFLPAGTVRDSLFGGLGLYAAGLLLVPCVLAGDYMFSLEWLTAPLLLSQLGLALHGAAGVIFPPPPPPDEDEDEEEEAEEPAGSEETADEQEDNDPVVLEERDPK